MFHETRGANETIQKNNIILLLLREEEAQKDRNLIDINILNFVFHELSEKSDDF